MKESDGMFDLDSVLPGWPGRRADFLEPLLRRGIEILRQKLERHPYVLIEYLVEFSYDGPFDKIKQIIACDTEKQLRSTLLRLQQDTYSSEYAQHPTWKPIYQSVWLAGTHSSYGYEFPSQVGGFVMGDTHLYEKMYVRYYMIPMPKSNSVDELAKYDGLQDALIDYVTKNPDFLDDNSSVN